MEQKSIEILEQCAKLPELGWTAVKVSNLVGFIPPFDTKHCDPLTAFCCMSKNMTPTEITAECLENEFIHTAAGRLLRINCQVMAEVINVAHSHKVFSRMEWGKFRLKKQTAS